MFKYWDCTDWVLAVLISILLACAVFVIWTATIAANRPTFTLNKDHWVCTRSHMESTMIIIGKIIVPSMHEVCTQYNSQ